MVTPPIGSYVKHRSGCQKGHSWQERGKDDMLIRPGPLWRERGVQGGTRPKGERGEYERSIQMIRAESSKGQPRMFNGDEGYAEVRLNDTENEKYLWKVWVGQPTWPKLADIYQRYHWKPLDQTGTGREKWSKKNVPHKRGRQAANLFLWNHTDGALDHLYETTGSDGALDHLYETTGSVPERRLRVIRGLTKRYHEHRILAVEAEEASSAPQLLSDPKAYCTNTQLHARTVSLALCLKPCAHPRPPPSPRLIEPASLIAVCS